MANATYAARSGWGRAGRALVGFLAAGSLALMISACNRGRDAEDPSSESGQNGQPQNGQLPQNGYGNPQGNQPGIPGQYNQPPPAGAPIAVAPSPFALPCQSDLVCGTHKCNMQTGRCAFPCGSNSDCASGFGCMGGGGPAAICIPGAGLPGTAPAAPAQPAPAQPPQGPQQF